MDLAGPHTFKPIKWPERFPLHIRIGTMELILHARDKRPKRPEYEFKL